VTVTNASAAAIGVTTVGITGHYADTTTCGSTIAAGGNCTVSVTFTPAAAGTRTGSLTITLSTGAQTVSLTGIGSSSSATGVLTLSPSPVTFTNGYTIGDNPSQAVKVTNTSASPAGIVSIAMGGGPSEQLPSQSGGGRDLHYHGDVQAGRVRHLYQHADAYGKRRRAGHGVSNGH
jgi:hypothetical protein